MLAIAVGEVDESRTDHLHEGMDTISSRNARHAGKTARLLLDEGLRSVDPELFYGVASDLNDLMPTHIDCSRDQSLPAYDKIRSAIGLSLVTNFTDIRSDVQLQIDLVSVWSSVSDVDPIIRMWADDRVASSLFGPSAMPTASGTSTQWSTVLGSVTPSAGI